MQTLNNAELTFLAVVGHPELTTKVLKVYSSGTILFSETFNPHLNVMWNAYIQLLTKYKKQYGLSLSKDITAAGLAEAVAASSKIPDETKTRCETLINKLTSGDIPDKAQGAVLVKSLMELDVNRKLVSKLNSNPDLLKLQQSLDAAKRTMSIVEDEQQKESVGVRCNPLRDIKKLARREVRVPTGLNFLDKISSGGGRAGDLWLILGSPGGGKCLGFNTNILMFDGSLKKVQDVTEGDLLMGPDSKPRVVQGVTKGRSTMYRIKMHRGDSFVCNYCHVLTLVVDNKKGLLFNGVRYAKDSLVDIPLDVYLALPESKKHVLKAVRTGVLFPQREAPLLDPYFVGLYLGDGSRSQARITTADAEVIEFCKQYAAEKGWACKIRPYARSKAVDVNFSRLSHKEVGVKVLLRQEIMLNDEKFIKDDYKLGSREVRLKLLAGLIDSDGYAHNGGYDLVLKGERLSSDVAFVARSLGYNVTRYSCTKKCTNTGAVGSYWRLYLGGDFSELPIQLSRRKSKRLTKRLNSAYVGFTVEELPEDDYYGFTLDSDGRFLLGDFTITHNTALATQYSCAQAMLGNSTLWATYEQSMEGDIAERMIANITDTSLDRIRDVGFENLPQEVQDHFWSAVAGVDDRLVALDMTKAVLDKEDPDDYGGVKSIWKQYNQLKAEGNAPKTIILDWFGSMMSKIAANLKLDLAACYRFKAQEEINNLIALAKQEKIMIIVFHQLSAKAAGARPTYLPNATEAQDMHNLQNFFDLVAVIGKRDVHDICYFSSQKSRKGTPITCTLKMIGEKSRFMLEEGWLPNRDGNFYKPGEVSAGAGINNNAASEYIRELD